jgi:fatty-acyl-CoA synthase
MKIEALNIRTAADVGAESSIPLASRYSERSTYELLQASALAHAERPALTFLMRGTPDEEPVVYRYRDFVARITQAANAFHRLGIGPTDVVAYLLPNLPQTHFAIWGGETAGRVAAINPLLEPSQILQILRAVQARMLITLAPGAAGLDLWSKCVSILGEVETLEHVLCVDPARLAANPRGPREYPAHDDVILHDFDTLLDLENGSRLDFTRRIEPGDIASLFHTGGTTGMPKVAPHTHANEVFLAWSVAATLGTQPGQSVFCGLPLFHVNAPLATGLGVWVAGGNVVLATPGGYRTPGLLGNLWGLLARHRVFAMMAVPTIYAALLDIPHGEHDLSNLRHCLVGAAPMPIEVFNRFERSTGVRLLEGYGMTESTAVSSLNPVEGQRKVGSIGLPLPYNELAIGRVEGTILQRFCGTDEVGVLLMRGPNVFPGYLDPSHNEKTWVVDDDGRRWFNSGDLARKDADGYLWLAGRAKDVIIRGGHNIDPQIIEERLSEHPDVVLAAAVGQPDAHAGELPMAYVVLREGSTATAEALRDFAAERVPERAAIPVRIEVLPQMPVTAVGKIFKPRLRHLAIERICRETLRAAKLAAAIDVRDDKRVGTVVTLRLADDASREAATEALARLPLAIEFELSPHVEAVMNAPVNHQFKLSRRPVGMVERSDFDYVEAPVAQPGDGEVQVKVLYISLDPAMRGWMNEGKSYIPPVGIGEVMRAGGVGRVVASNDPAIAVGDHVVGMLGVQEYAIAKGKNLTKVDPRLAPLPVYLGTLGMPGMTAYFGLLEVGRPNTGDTVVVSGAAGAVGQVVGQIAKIKGCRVVGIAGGPDKCAYLRSIGFDAAIDYKNEDLKASLKQHCPKGVDVYFDNVGGEILDTVLTQLAMHARIVICGAISQYNEAKMKGPSNYMSLLVHRASMTGMVVFDYANRYAEAAREMAGWMATGQLKTREDIVEGLETFPETLLKLFKGENTGKLVLKVADA